MAEMTIPAWRLALNSAWSGVRSGFGLFPATSNPARAAENCFLERLEQVLEIDMSLTNETDQSDQTVPHSSEAVPTEAVEQELKVDAISRADEILSAWPFVEKEPAPVPAPLVSIPTVPAPMVSTPSVEPIAAVAAAPKRTAKSTTRRKLARRPVAEHAALLDPLAAGEPPSLQLQPPATAAASSPQRGRTAQSASKRKLAKKPVVAQPVIAQPAANGHSSVANAVAAVESFRANQPLVKLLTAEQVAIPPHQVALEQMQAQTLAQDPAAQSPQKQRKLVDSGDQSPFSISVGQVYDGPLDLLLDLIRRQDIDIYDIPIAKITAQFLAYVNQLKASDMDVAGEFIYTASLLIHIKSKMLLPRSPSGPDDAPEDPRRELVERLLEHERFKNAAQMLQQKQMLEAATWTNPGFREFADDAAAEPEIAADTVDLVRIFRDILDRARNRPVLDVEEDSATVGQMIQFLARRLSMEDKPVALRRLLSHTRSERALVAMFLALLELVRLQAVLLRQDRAFSEIFIKKHIGFDAVMNEGLANARDDWR